MGAKTAHIERQRALQLQNWVRSGLILGVFIFLSLSLLDYFYLPKLFSQFLIYRVAISVVILAVYALLRLSTHRLYQQTLMVILVLAGAATIQLMIMADGGHKSAYYAGQVLLITFVLAFTPVSTLFAFVIAALIYLTYLLPIFMFDTITDVPTFAMHNAFILITIIGIVTFRRFSSQELVKQLELEYDLNEEKKKIEGQAETLDEMVKARTNELLSTTKKYQDLFENANDGILIMDKNGIIQEVNSRLCTMYGYTKEGLRGTHIHVLEGVDNSTLFKQQMAKLLPGNASVFEAAHLKRDGEGMLVEISANIVDVEKQLIMCFVRDITERRRIQDLLRQSQKMEAIGILSGGLAHDYNNLLTAILGHSQQIAAHVGGTPLAYHTQQIEACVSHGAAISQSLLTFSRKEKEIATPTVLELSEVVSGSIPLLRMMIEEEIDLDISMSDKKLLVVAGKAQIQQCVINLALNAKDAMRGRGRLSISTNMEVWGDDRIPYATVTISDTGVGMSQNLQERIFEPFFTTKEVGKGTGLGLSIVYGIVKQLNGQIAVKSEEGTGSSFTIYLPLVQREAAVDVLGGNGGPPRGDENVLLVEDNPFVRSIFRDILSGQGYHVIEAGDGEEAVLQFSASHKAIDLVVCDVVMPKKSGKEVYDVIRTMNPTTKFIFMSGYTSNVLQEKGFSESIHLLRKPVSGYQLLQEMRAVLDEREH